MAQDKRRSQAPTKLLHKRAEELERLRDAEQTIPAGDQREVTGELSTVDQHPADTSDIIFQRELQATTREILERERQQVEDALQAQARGTYGQCQECGEKIPSERLEARPQATLCLDCQRRQEANRVE